MTPEIIIHNDAFMTFNTELPTAQALAIADGKITAVGMDAEITAFAGADTQMIDAIGGTVLPGIIDSHVHLFGGSVELDLLDLYGITGLDAMREKSCRMRQRTLTTCSFSA